MADSVLFWHKSAASACADAEIVQTNDPASVGQSRLELETLYLIRRPEVIRFLLSFGVNAVEAEDITQEAFLRGFDQCRKNKQIDNFFYWLLACARNLALNRIRHGKYEVAAPSERWKQGENSSLRTDLTPETELLEKEENRLLTEAISTLSALEQQCILLRFQDLPFRKIASTLEISMRSAVYHTGTGIRKLQRKLTAPSL